MLVQNLTNFESEVLYITSNIIKWVLISSLLFVVILISLFFYNHSGSSVIEHAKIIKIIGNKITVINDAKRITTISVPKNLIASVKLGGTYIVGYDSKKFQSPHLNSIEPTDW
ncbi:putative membrane protein (Fun14 family) [Paenibacillus shirakamiensis]|uniref:Membrane protein (Fun14 family) n=1 Tax=Paenibacillus shirakamiensis TaxID=1265935 RepID=A0ABS4JKQ7_9BACL|nr:putative membrane protein (Fun14 family) [Paenibacillus shirakamiensis]